MGDISNTQHKSDGAKIPSETFKAQATTPTSGQVPGIEIQMGSDTSSIGSTRKFYRAAEKR